MHLAAALKIPVVAIFVRQIQRATAPSAPIDRPAKPASRTDHTRHQAPEQGLLEIGVSEVVAAAGAFYKSK